ncbi:MAG: hypothetical protein FWE85_05345 [Clostridiales bacterium]|nr:hypothetical protein [Clostridiales bacterium]
MTDEIFTNFIQAWADEHKIINKCNEGFWQCFENYKTEVPKKFSEVFPNEKNGVSIVLEKICFCLGYYIKYDERPTVQVDFCIFLEDSEIGWYREIYFTDGEFVDEFFVIE